MPYILYNDPALEIGGVSYSGYFAGKLQSCGGNRSRVVLLERLNPDIAVYSFSQNRNLINRHGTFKIEYELRME